MHVDGTARICELVEYRLEDVKLTVSSLRPELESIIGRLDFRHDDEFIAAVPGEAKASPFDTLLGSSHLASVGAEAWYETLSTARLSSGSGDENTRAFTSNSRACDEWFFR